MDRMLAIIRNNDVEEKEGGKGRYKAILGRLLTSIGILVFFYFNPITFLNDRILSPLGLDIGEFKVYIDGVFYIFSVFLTAYYSYKLTSMMTRDILARYPRISRIRYMVEIVVSVVSLLVAITVTVNTLAVKFEAVGKIESLLSGIAGNLLSLFVTFIIAIQVGNILANYVAGIIFRLEDIAEEGDFIVFQGEMFRVRERGWYALECEDRFGNIVYIPNMLVVTNKLCKAFSKTGYRYVEVKFSLPYSMSIEEVKKRVDNAMSGVKRIIDYKLLIYDLSNYGVVYELQVMPKKPMFVEQLRSIVRAALIQEFKQLLMTPTIINFQPFPNNPAEEKSSGSSKKFHENA
ncbi:MAG: hypothetical protein DRJ47_04725 [Thermoprotei archaeon]|nr:MAG: hypothetical protein DRJ47_04725 [Thermoprotei archaeon]